MNPWPMVLADLRALRWTAPAIILLVALAIASGVAIGAQEQALRQGSARAADDFDLIIGAPGSQTQLLMSAVYLQPDALPLVDGRILKALAQDERVAELRTDRLRRRQPRLCDRRHDQLVLLAAGARSARARAGSSRRREKQCSAPMSSTSWAM
jgi:hypothetical protein